MIAYILSKTDLKIKDFFYFKDFLFTDDLEYADKSQIVIPRLVNVVDDDFVYCKDESNKMVFFGVAHDTATNDKTDNFALTMRQKECLFDRFVFANNADLLATSVESFVVQTITDNWVSSNDPLMDRAYINPVAVTNTPVVASLSNIVNVQDGVFNLKTFLGNIKERYSIYVDFVLTNTAPGASGGAVLTVNVYKNSADTVPIDTDVSDIYNVEETYSVDVLAKLNVKWLNTTNETITYRTYYLLTNRSISTNVSDTDRVDGTIKSIYVEAETEAEMYDEVINEFQRNSYEHKITFYLRENSKLYLPDDYYVGRKCQIETKTGVKESLITAIERESSSGVRKITMGKLKVTLTSKLRGTI